MDTAEKTVDTATEDVSKLEYYKDTLIELNGVEEKNEFQKFQLKKIVDELSGSIPELAEAYDEEKGSIKLANDEIKKLIENEEKQIMLQATQEAKEKVYTALAKFDVGNDNGSGWTNSSPRKMEC